MFHFSLSTAAAAAAVVVAAAADTVVAATAAAAAAADTVSETRKCSAWLKKIRSRKILGQRFHWTGGLCYKPFQRGVKISPHATFKFSEKWFKTNQMSAKCIKELKIPEKN